MPVILNPSAGTTWLDAKEKDAERLSNMLRPYPGMDLDVYAVSTYVNKPSNTGAQCIEPLA